MLTGPKPQKQNSCFLMQYFILYLSFLKKYRNQCLLSLTVFRCALFFKQRYSMKRKFVILTEKQQGISTLPILSSIVLRSQKWGPCFWCDTFVGAAGLDPLECTPKANVDHTHVALSPVTHPLRQCRCRRRSARHQSCFTRRVFVFGLFLQSAKPDLSDVSLT